MSQNDFVAGEILIFTPFLAAFGGVERLILALSRYLHEHNHPHRVLCFEDSIRFASHAPWPVCVHPIAAPRSPRAEAKALQQELQRARAAGGLPPLLFDLKSAFYAGASPLPPFFLHLTDPPSLLPLDVSKRAPSARRAVTAFGAMPRPSLVRALHAETVHQLNRRGARSARQTLVMTHTIAHEIARLYGVQTLIVRPGVAPPSLPKKREGKGMGEFSLVSVSRLEANKRVDWMLRSLHALETASPKLSEKTDWKLHIVGGGSQEAELKALAANLDLNGRAIFHGRVSDSELEAIYGDADLSLMPAVQGYGLPALESLARRVPVILHRESGVAEILGDTPFAAIIERDCDDLTRALDTMIARIGSGALKDEPPPPIPTEMQWAEQISRACQWF